MKLLVNRAPVNGPWGGGNNFVSALFQYAHEFDVQVGTKLNQPYDAILIIDPRVDELGIGLNEIQRYKLFKPKTKVFQRVNECDARKGARDDMDLLLLGGSTLNDHTFFVSQWMSDYHTRLGWKCGSTSVIYNGVDKEIFKPQNRGLIVTDAHIVRIVTHHWSDNPFKGEDVHKWLDGFVAKNPEFKYTYIGRTQAKLPNSEVIEPLHGPALGEELKKHNIYVTGTVCDPGPNHVIEALACGIPTYAHKRGGGAVEFVGKDHTFDSVEALEAFIRQPTHTKNHWTPGDWRTCVGEYITKMQEVLNVKT